MKKKMVTTEFVTLLCDRFTAAELAEFLDISVEEFCEMFEADLEYNYNDLCEFIGYSRGENTYDDGRSDDHDEYADEDY